MYLMSPQNIWETLTCTLEFYSPWNYYTHTDISSLNQVAFTQDSYLNLKLISTDVCLLMKHAPSANVLVYLPLFLSPELRLNQGPCMWWPHDLPLWSIYAHSFFKICFQERTLLLSLPGLSSNSKYSCSASWVAGIIGICHQSWLPPLNLGWSYVLSCTKRR